jgi:hypothetical protein
MACASVATLSGSFSKSVRVMGNMTPVVVVPGQVWEKSSLVSDMILVSGDSRRAVGDGVLNRPG